MKSLLLIISAFVLGYLILVVFTYARQRSLLYFPTREIEATPRDIGLDYEELTLRTKDGLDIAAWYVPAENARGFLLFCHGNAGNVSHRLDSIRIFHGLGLNVLIFDYRGYGKSEGSPDEEGTYRDAEAAWAYLVERFRAKPERTVLFGRSLGGAVATELASRKPSAALILESTFTSVPDLAKKYFPHLPVRLISRYRYASIDKVKKLTVPKLFIHSPEDEIVPYEHGMELFERAGEPKEFLRISGGHNEGFLLSGKLYTEGLRAFLEKHLLR